jgi:hypothetical protein
VNVGVVAGGHRNTTASARPAAVRSIAQCHGSVAMTIGWKKPLPSGISQPSSIVHGCS